MQNRDAGWAAFDRDVDRQLLTKVPFADHNAMLDPSCPDITARVLEALGHYGYRVGAPRGAEGLPGKPGQRGLAVLAKEGTQRVGPLRQPQTEPEISSGPGQIGLHPQLVELGADPVEGAAGLGEVVVERAHADRS